MSLNNWPVTLVDTRFTDGVDESILNSAIHNTCTEFWQWARDNGTHITISEHAEDDIQTWSTRLKLIATFDDAADAALFRLNFDSTLPYRLLQITPTMEAYFH